LDGVEDYTVKVTTTTGDFIFKFPSALIKGSQIKIWKAYKKRNWRFKKTTRKTGGVFYIVHDVTTTDSYNDLLIREKKTLISLRVRKLDSENMALKNTELTYKATISNSFFQIPLVRFNFIDEANKQGTISLFSSVGAGFGVNWGRMHVTRDDSGLITNTEFDSTFGIHVGALFSADTGENSKNIFAPTINASFLDFQIGVGYELGTIADNQKRAFVTLAYAIPLYKLIKGKYRVWRMAPMPIESRKANDPTK
jgi:hypothetical protein